MVFFFYTHCAYNGELGKLEPSGKDESLDVEMNDTYFLLNLFFLLSRCNGAGGWGGDGAYIFGQLKHCTSPCNICTIGGLKQKNQMIRCSHLGQLIISVLLK